jgi:hypothetical protein
MVQKTPFKGGTLHKIQHLLAAAVLLPCLALAQPSGFAIKGKTLGIDQTEACESAATDDFPKSKEIAAANNIVFLGTACDVPVNSLAGIAQVPPLGLVFWNGKLIRVVARIETMDMHRAASVRSSLMDAYGKPTTRRNKPFVTDTWRAKGQTLQLEMNWDESDSAAAGIYLTNIAGWAEFIKAIDRIERVKSDADRRRRQADLLR